MAFSSFFFGRKQNSNNNRRSVKLNRNTVRTRTLSMEPLESRDLLSVTTGAIDNTEYSQIRAQYPDFNLPERQADLNVITVDLDEGATALKLEDFKTAISTAGTTTKSDLILVKTSASSNSVTYTSNSDEITIDIDSSQYGSVTIIGWGEENFTLNANKKSRGMSISGSSTVVNLGGLTITRGKSDGSISNSLYGGGIYVNSGSLTITKSTISGNNGSSCGGIYNISGSLTITKSAVSENTGCGVYISGSYSTLTLIDSEISENAGCGVYNDTSYSTITLANCVISRNSGTGGGIFNAGNNGTTTFTVTNSTISGNACGICNSSGTLTVTNSTISENTVSSSGGGIYNYSGTLTVSNSTISGNTASSGGGIYNYFGTLIVTNSTITGNTASSFGGGIYNYNSGTLTVINSIVSRNYNGNIYGYLSTTSSNNLIGNYYPGFVTPPQFDSNGNLTNADTMDLHLRSDSIAIDKGDNSAIADIETDFDGNARIFGETVDLGAYEYQGDRNDEPIPYSTVVNTLNDSFDLTDNEWSLREAIYYAPEYVTITFADNLEGTIVLTLGQLEIEAPLAIDGGNRITIDADQKSRVFYISAGTEESPVVLNGLTIQNGRASYGGGIYSDNGILTVTNSMILGNAAYESGGGFYNCGTLTVTNSEISGNDAYQDGGGIYNNYETLTVTNCTIAGNSASAGGGILNYAATRVYNSIIACNIAGSGNDIYKNAGNIYGYNSLSSYTAWNNGTDNIVYDLSLSLFIDAKNGDYRLSPDSQAINKGSNQYANNAGIDETWTDISGNPRFMSNSIDIGAYEFKCCASPVLYTPSVEDDIVTVTWSGVEHASGYQFEYKSSSDSGWSLKTVSGVSTTFKRDPTQKYIVRIKTLGGDGYADSPYSSEMTIRADSPINYATVRETYSNFNLPELESDINIIFLDLTAGDNLVDLKSVIAEAGTTTKPDLILVQTSVSANSVVYTSNTDEVSIDIDSTQYGSVTIIGWGEENFTLDANQQSRVMSISGSSTVVNLGGLTIQNGKKSGYGAGINNDGTLSLTNCTISGNTASSSNTGGGIYNSRILTVTNSTISGNTASSGGGIYNSSSSSTLTLTNCTISGNSSSSGGGVYNSSGTLTITNSEICENTVSSYGGGIYNSGSSSILTLTNCTISGNSSSSGGGSYNTSGTTKIYNSIIACNTTTNGNDIYKKSGNIYGYNSLSSYTAWDSGKNNIIYDSSQPLFIDAENGNYRLSPDSQAIDKGNNQYAKNAGIDETWTDMSGNPRFMSNSIDIGAYEFMRCATPALNMPSVEDETVFVTWSSVEYASSYQFEYKLSTDSEWTVKTVSGVSTTFERDPMRKYFVRVKALGGENCTDSTYSSEMTIRADSLINYTTVREAYPEFNLPESESDINILVVDLTTGDDLADLKNAISTAGTTTLPDLILVKTSTSANSVTYTSNSDEITININSTQYGSVTIIGWGDERFTLDANQQSRVMTISGSSTIVNLGGLTITSGNSSSSMSNTSYGGGIYNSGILTITNSEISGNTAKYSGGGIYNSSGTLTITNSTISGNIASGSSSSYGGGGIYNNAGSLTVTNSTISGNTVSSCGGGIYNSGALTITNSTISGNTASRNGCGIYNSGSSATTRAYNSIIACNTSSKDVYRNSGSIYGYNSLSSYTAWNSGTDNIVYDSSLPLFIDATNGDYRLSPNSLAIDKGDNQYANNAGMDETWTDLSGNPRFMSNSIDIGAYEFMRCTTPVLYTPSIEDDTISVTWSSVEHASGYQLEYKMSTDSEWTVKIVSGVSTMFESAPNQIYIVRVKALGEDDYADSSYSSEMTIINYATIREAYSEFDLPESENDINIHFVNLTAGDDLDDLKNAIADAGVTTKPDLILVQTSASANSVTYRSNADEISISINASQYGSVTIIGWGEEKFTLDANQKSHVMTISGSSTVVNLGGLSIVNGNSNASKSSTNAGGGIYNYSGTLTITDSEISRNTAYNCGGGIYNRGTLTVINSTISGNTVSGASSLIGGGIYNDGTLRVINSEVLINTASDGGGIYNSSSGIITVTNSSISGNTASLGGGIYNFLGSLTVIDSEISGNTAKGSYGGGIYNSSGTLTVTNCTISENTVAESLNSFGLGGGIHSSAGTITVSNSMITRNTASGKSYSSGGGIYNSSGILTVSNCTISENTVSGSSYCTGGGIHNSLNSTFTVINSIISRNIVSGSSISYGGGIYNDSNSLTVTNSTISGNTALDGGGIFNSSGPLTVTNSVISGNMASSSGGGIYHSSGTLTVTNSIVGRNFNGNFYANPSFVRFNILIDNYYPYFVCPPQFDSNGNLTNADTVDLHLRSDSIAIDKGDNSAITDIETDIDGNARIFGGIVDIGAYEYQGDRNDEPIPYSTVVNTLNDSFDLTDNEWSLREAIYYAPEYVTITFADNLEGTIVLTLGQLEIEAPLAIDGDNRITIDADQKSRVFYVAAGTEDNPVVFNGLTIRNGNANTGGGIYNYYGSLTVTNCTISGNTAYSGGGIYNTGSNPTLMIINSEITGNTASGSSSSYGGGGIYNNNGALTVTNSTISGNIGYNGGGVYNDTSSSTTRVYNTIIACNTATNGNDVYKNAGSVYDYNSLSSYTAWDGGNDNIVYDPKLPLFIDAENGDYHLIAGSQAIDMGNNDFAVDPEGVALAYDLDGSPRIVNGTVDIGAYESDLQNLLTVPEFTLTAENAIVTVAWSAVTNASSYTVLYQIDGTDDWTKITNILGTTTSFVGLAGTTYNVRVQANGTSNYGDSEFSESSSITLAVPPTTLSDLTLSTTTPKVGTVLTATLSPSDATVEYQWYCGSEIITGATASSFTVTAAQIGQTITCVATGTGNYTGSVSATTAVVPLLPLETPNAPTLTAEDTTVTVSWSTINNASSYTVEYQADGSDGWFVITGINGTTTSFVGIAGTTYNVKVQANGTGNYSDSSYSESSSITLAVPPTALTALTLSTNSPVVGSTIIATLSPSDATVEYQWYCGTTIIDKATASSFTVTAAQIGQTITCVATGTGNYTGTVSATTAVVPAMPLDAPTAPSLTAVGTTITAEWLGVNNASSYTVQYQIDGADGWMTVTDILGTTTSFIGMAGTTYNVKVQANGTGNYSDSSFSESASITLAVPPTALTGLTLSTTTPEVGTVLTTTLSPSDATVEYQWYCGSERITGATTSSFTVTVAHIGQTITCVATGTGNYTGPVSATTAVVPALPLDMPNAPTLTVEGATITATWSAVSNASGYTMLYQIDGADGWMTITDILGTTSSFIGMAGTTYNVKIQANGSTIYANSEFSEVASITLAVPPTQLTGLTLSSYAPEVGTTITAMLDQTGAAADYQWYCDSERITGATASSFTVTVAQIGQTITCVATGTGEYTGSVSATTAVVPALPLGTPNVPALTAEGTTITATWSAVTNASSYTVEYQADGSDGWFVITGINGTTTSFIGTVGTTYNVRVQANGTGNYTDSNYSESASITLAVPPTTLSGLILSTDSPIVGTILTTTLSPSDATVEYQWFCGETAITGATESSFTVTEEQIGQTITCVATGTGNYTGTVSAATAVVPALTLDTPDKPTLTVEDTTITATWSAVSNTSSYTVEYQADGSDGWFVITGVNGTTTSFIGTSGTTYNVHVQANGKGNYSDSSFSESASITLAVPPTALTGLTLSTTTPEVGTVLTATLSPSDATVEYQWYCGSEKITGTTASSFTVTSAQIGQTITCVATGTGNYTGSVSATTAVVPTLPLDAPNAPTLTVEYTLVSVTWSTVTNASSYTVQYQIDGADGWTTVTDILGTTTSFVGIAGSTYNVKVQANGTGNYSDSNYSEVASITLAVSPTTLSGLTLSTTTPEVGTVIATTLSPSDATVEYQWYCGTTIITGATESSFTVSQSQIGQTITCVATGIGNYTGTVSAATAVVPAITLDTPDKPTLTVEDTTITATWSAVSNTSSYTVEYQADGSDGWFVITGVNGTTTSFIGTSGTTYNVRVQANGTRNYSNSSFSESASITLAVPPTTLSGLTLSTTMPEVGTVLTATLSPSDATVEYQWFCGTTIIDKATASSFTVTESQIGQTITCVATGTDNYTGTVSATTAVVPALPLGTPNAPLLTAEGATITATWSAINNASSYTVQYQIDGTDGWTTVTDILGTTTSFVGLAGTTYNVRVQANGTGKYSDSSYSEAASITLAVPPTPLTGLTLSNYAPEVGTVITTTLSPSDATADYQWYCGSTIIDKATASSFTVTAAQIGQTITCVATGTGNYTGSVSATTAVVPALPLGTPNVPALTAEGTTVTATWSTVTNASSYTVEYQADGSDGWFVITGINGTTTSFVGIAGTKYNVKVQANGTGNYSDSEFGESSSITLVVPPTALTELTLSTTAPEVGTVITTTLSPSDATVEYQWYCGSEIIAGATTSSFTVTAAHIGQTITCVATGTGNYTGSVSATTAVVPALTLDTPDKPTLTVEDTTITATWSAVSNASSYTVEYQADGSDGWFVISGINGTTTSFIGTSGTTYNVRVQANGTGNYSDSSFSESSSITLAVSPTALNGLTLSTTTPEVGTVLTATLSPSDATVEYQWCCGSEIITGATASSFTVTEEQIGQTITCVATGTGNYTGTVSATTAVVPALPLGTPNAPSLTAEGTTITVEWLGVNNTSSYTVEYQVDGSDGWFVITGINGTTTSFIGTARTTYNVRIQANGTGNYSDSNYSESVSITLAVPLTQITGLTLSTDSPIVGTILTTTLTPSDATVEYQWYCGSEIITGATASSFNVTESQIGQTITCVATGTGNYTGSVSATTAVVPTLPLDTPNVPTLTVEDTTITATWSAINNASSYTVEYKFNSSDWLVLAITEETTALLIGQPGCEYSFRVKANGMSIYSDSDYSPIQTITTNDSVLVAQNDLVKTTLNNPVIIDYRENDNVMDWSLVSVQFGNALHGEYVVNEDGTIMYTPEDGFFGTDGFGYVLFSPSGKTSVGMISINVNLPIAPSVQTSSSAHNPTSKMAASVENMTDWDNCYIELWAEGVNELNAGEATITLEYNPAVYAAPVLSDCAEGASLSVSQSVLLPNGNIQVELTTQVLESLSSQTDNLFLGTVVLSPSSEAGAGVEDVLVPEPVCVLDGVSLAPTVEAMPYDLIRNGSVDVNDFVAFATVFGLNPNNLSPDNPVYAQAVMADFNNDGIVNVDDFILFATNYGATKKTATIPMAQASTTADSGNSEWSDEIQQTQNEIAVFEPVYEEQIQKPLPVAASSAPLLISENKSESSMTILEAYTAALLDLYDNQERADLSGVSDVLAETRVDAPIANYSDGNLRKTSNDVVDAVLEEDLLAIDWN